MATLWLKVYPENSNRLIDGDEEYQEYCGVNNFINDLLSIIKEDKIKIYEDNSSEDSNEYSCIMQDKIDSIINFLNKKLMEIMQSPCSEDGKKGDNDELFIKLHELTGIWSLVKKKAAIDRNLAILMLE